MHVLVRGARRRQAGIPEAYSRAYPRGVSPQVSQGCTGGVSSGPCAGAGASSPGELKVGGHAPRWEL